MNETASLLDDYQARLRRASADLPVELRDELLDDVEAHLAELRATSPTPEATRAALARLGEPETLAAAAHEELGSRADPPPPPAVGWTPPAAPTRVRALDVVAVVMLLVGALVLPLVGWFVGVVLLWASTTWTWREKTLGTLVVPGGLATPLLLALLPGQTCSYTETVDADGTVDRSLEICEGFALPPWFAIPLLLVTLIGPPLVAALLLRRARARAGTV